MHKARHQVIGAGVGCPEEFGGGKGWPFANFIAIVHHGLGGGKVLGHIDKAEVMAAEAMTQISQGAACPVEAKGLPELD